MAAPAESGATAIGLPEARKEGKNVPKRKSKR